MKRLDFLRAMGLFTTALLVAPSSVVSQEKMPDFGSLFIKENYIKYCRWLCRNGPHRFWMICNYDCSGRFQEDLVLKDGKVWFCMESKPCIDWEDYIIKSINNMGWAITRVNTVTFPTDLKLEEEMMRGQYRKLCRLSIDKIHTI